MISIEGDSEPELLLRSEFTETNAELSLDGQSKVSNAGAVLPLRSRAGQKLFYRTPGRGRLTAVPVETDPAFDTQNPQERFEWPYFTAAEVRTYDMAPDGQRFLAINPVPLETDADSSLPDLWGATTVPSTRLGGLGPAHWDSARWIHHCDRERRLTSPAAWLYPNAESVAAKEYQHGEPT